MIGVIVTGHGTFATGMKEAVRLLAGRPESFEAVDYLQEDSTDDYEAKLRAALSALRGCTGVLILADMLEAAPYKVCADVRRKVIVIGFAGRAQPPAAVFFAFKLITFDRIM